MTETVNTNNLDDELIFLPLPCPHCDSEWVCILQDHVKQKCWVVCWRCNFPLKENKMKALIQFSCLEKDKNDDNLYEHGCILWNEMIRKYRFGVTPLGEIELEDV